VICSMTSSGLEIPPDQNASHNRSILLRSFTRNHESRLAESVRSTPTTSLAACRTYSCSCRPPTARWVGPERPHARRAAPVADA